MDDIEDKALEINKLHASLKLTHERETNSSITFLDMMTCHYKSELTDTPYQMTLALPSIIIIMQ